MHPMRYFIFDTGKQTFTGTGNAVYQWNALQTDGTHLFVGGYGNGALLDWDITKPFTGVEKKPRPNDNPYNFGEATPEIHRPSYIVLMPDQRTLVMAGTPGYGRTGGGLVLADRERRSMRIIPQNRMMSPQSVNSLLPLSEKTLLCGGTVTPGTGGRTIAKEAELGIKIYLISDEPYREIAYGAEVPWVPAVYSRTIVCYSYSKSLSLPGERIGWLYAADQMGAEADDVYAAICGAGRALGFVCAPALFQRVIERCIDEPSDVRAYAENRELLTSGLSELGYEYVEPQGAFYLWVRALEPDAQAFAERAKAHELLLVPSDSFGVTGWVRIGYCVDADVIRNSMPAFKALAEEYR